MARKPKRPRKGEDYRFRIDAWTPEKIPMVRLAEYMRELSQLLGEQAHVHFDRIARGSTVIKYNVEREAIPKVRGRVARVKSGDGPVDALRAFEATNKMLRDDNAVGALKVGATILRFPGREQVQEEFTSVRQQGFFDGVVIGVRGRDQSRHIIMMVEDQQVSGFYTNRTIAKQLAMKYDEPVRLFGRGKWQRDADGNWTLIEFKIESFEPLDAAPFSSVLEDLRAIPIDWGDDPYNELGTIRHGPRGKANGGH